MSAPEFFRQDSGATVAVQKRAAAVAAELAAAYARWEELEALRGR
jgi:hypothetical protein